MYESIDLKFRGFSGKENINISVNNGLNFTSEENNFKARIHFTTFAAIFCE
jgi:hypothetical protein